MKLDVFEMVMVTLLPLRSVPLVGLTETPPRKGTLARHGSDSGPLFCRTRVADWVLLVHRSCMLAGETESQFGGGVGVGVTVAVAVAVGVVSGPCAAPGVWWEEEEEEEEGCSSGRPATSPANSKARPRMPAAA